MGCKTRHIVMGVVFGRLSSFLQGGYPSCETLGEGEKLASDGNFTPLLILFPKMQET